MKLCYALEFSLTNTVSKITSPLKLCSSLPPALFRQWRKLNRSKDAPDGLANVWDDFRYCRAPQLEVTSYVLLRHTWSKVSAKTKHVLITLPMNNLRVAVTKWCKLLDTRTLSSSILASLSLWNKTMPTHPGSWLHDDWWEREWHNNKLKIRNFTQWGEAFPKLQDFSKNLVCDKSDIFFQFWNIPFLEKICYSKNGYNYTHSKTGYGNNLYNFLTFTH